MFETCVWCHVCCTVQPALGGPYLDALNLGGGMQSKDLFSGESNCTKTLLINAIPYAIAALRSPRAIGHKLHSVHIDCTIALPLLFHSHVLPGILHTSHTLCTYAYSFMYSSMQSLTHSLTESRTHHARTHAHSHTLSPLTHVNTHSLTPSLSHSRTLTHTHTHTQ